MDKDQLSFESSSHRETHVVHEFPTGRVIAFAGVFVLGFAVVVAVLMTRRKRG